ncbi:MAG: putative peptidoglycan glycosyltransferase FtsW [Parasphingopyxis sp.]|uniref:FtsW/RodA/SpoVE family cell cycle protein n=1 Tax=Parasphingopyxis sp. TaxID=1920299 RepID=UPI00262CD13F|nr:putative peptidoglycan glycosyltransferase FtsW [uncultured Parasphingopyxis sp.]
MNMEPVTVRQRRQFGDFVGRSQKGPIGEWFWEIDRVLLLLVTILISIGLIAIAAAAPAAAERYSGAGFQYAELYYFYRQLMWLGVAIPTMLVISTMPKELAKRFALGGAVCFLVLLIFVPFIGNEVNGAQRWLGYGLATFQPSEFLKPFFIVACAWLLSLRITQDPGLPVVAATGILTGIIGLLLMRQPDFGQTVIFGAVWFVLLMLSGVSGKLLGALFGGGIGGFVAAYLFYPVATTRINAFIYGEGDTFQTDNAMGTLTNGGFFGTGPGDGVMKYNLPEPHTDYIFSVIGEEFGLIACLAVALLFAAIVVRVFVKLLNEENVFYLLASAGLATQFAMQASINMAVNLGMAPSKGMTLPFISYGGSSLIALSIGFGLLLAFTRRNPHMNARDRRIG